jgi:uncharacterized protein (UPF0332 family)
VDSAEHVAVAQRNEQFFDDFPPSHTDWRATVLFYAALHLVQAFLATKNQKPKSHDEVTRMIRDHVDLTPIRDAYAHLGKVSWNARYEGFAPTDAQVAHLRQAYYDALKARIFHLLGRTTF